MLCDKCGKKQATVHVKQVINGRETEEHLCENCAGHIWEFGDLDLNKLFSAAFVKPRPTVSCKSCGLSLAEFNESGRLGCGDCYASFTEELAPVINKFHGTKRHIGKLKRAGGQMLQDPALADKNYEKLALQKQLAELVAVERFEEAAEVRDKIKAIEAELRDWHDGGGKRAESGVSGDGV